MGHSTWSDVVPFVIHSILQVKSSRVPSNEFEQMICLPHAYLEGEYCDNPRPVIQNGWTYDSAENPPLAGKNKRLYGDIWRKIDSPSKVWIINESEFESVGEYDMSVIADNRVAIEEFAQDFNLTQAIKEVDSVQQSG